LNSQESTDDSTKENLREAEFTGILVECLAKILGAESVECFGGELGIITPYRGQVRLLKSMWSDL
jgi:superfamily I DNA and/or RNA helicase